MDLSIGLHKLQHRNNQHDDQHDDGESGSFRLVEPSEALLVDVKEQHSTSVIWCSFGHNDDVVN